MGCMPGGARYMYLACLLCLLETGPVPAYSHALERRSGPRYLHKCRVLAPRRRLDGM